METVYWLSNSSINELLKNANENKQSYMSGSFDNFFKDKKNHLRDVGVSVDLEKLGSLSGHSKDEVEDSCKVFSAISGMTPTLAVRPNIWVYLSHTHLLEYGRTRWISDEKDIAPHFLSISPAKLRDDHASSRPWWNAYIASRIAVSDDIDEIRKVLETFARTTDTRSQSFERPSVFGDIHLARLLMQKINETPKLAEEREFRQFMKNVNFASNGVKFSEMTYETFSEKFG